MYSRLQSNTATSEGCDDSTPVRGASYEPVVLLGVSAEPRLSTRRQREEIFHCVDASRSAICGHRGLFSASKDTTTACLPTYLPTYLLLSNANTTMTAYTG